MNLSTSLLDRYHEINALQKAQSLLGWDMQVFMPRGGTAARSAHAAILSRMAHELFVSPETARLVEDAEQIATLSTVEAAALRELRREIDLRSRLPVSLVERKARTSAEAYEIWRRARSESKFKPLAPYLKELFDIARETAELRGFKDHIYDPLLDSFEQGATCAEAQAMFESIKGPITELVASAAENPPDDSFLYADWDQDRLVRFVTTMAAEIGFDFDRGRIDVTTNAFCTNCSCNDVRLTARPSKHLGGILFSGLHEMGHGLYEQNSPAHWDRTPLAGGISLGLHESQSRTWENIVGRSRGLWQHFYPRLQAAFPELDAFRLDTFCRAINRVKPGPIRIGADELTYNLHILIRFELECEILTGKVKIEELPEAWNEKYREYLGVVPANDGEGCLQDVHWSRGSVGYFPTYAMGNMIGWQIWERLREDIPYPEELMAKGEFNEILGWLTTNVYSQGRRYTPRELVVRVTGKPMSSEAYINGMRAKYG